MFFGIMLSADIRMKFPCETVVGDLYRFGIGIFSGAEYLVIVFELHSRFPAMCKH